MIDSGNWVSDAPATVAAWKFQLSHTSRWFTAVTGGGIRCFCCFCILSRLTRGAKRQGITSVIMFYTFSIPFFSTQSDTATKGCCYWRYERGQRWWWCWWWRFSPVLILIVLAQPTNDERRVVLNEILCHAGCTPKWAGGLCTCELVKTWAREDVVVFPFVLMSFVDDFGVDMYTSARCFVFREWFVFVCFRGSFRA